MLKTKRKFNRKNATTFALINRPLHAIGEDEDDEGNLKVSTAEELLARKEEEHKCGIYYNDNYDYMRHLRDVSSYLGSLEPVEKFRMTSASDAVLDALSVVLITERAFQPPPAAPGPYPARDLLTSLAPPPAPSPPPDLDLVASMSDTFDCSDPANLLDDDFLLQAGGAFTPYTPVYDSDEDYPGVEEDVGEREEKGSRVSKYSMSSSVMRRSEGLKTLDQHFEHMFGQYDEEEIGGLDLDDHEERIDNLVLRTILAEQAKKDVAGYSMEEDEADSDSSSQPAVDEVALKFRYDDPGREELVRVVLEEDDDTFDCHSIISHRSDRSFQPKVISVPGKIGPVTPTENDDRCWTTMLKPSSLIGMHSVRNPVPSTYIPNNNSLFTLIREMDRSMSTRKKFIEVKSGWNPLVSELYFGVLSVIQTFRCMRSADILPVSLRSFLAEFERHYDPASLWIPGPLVPHVKALCVIDPTNGSLGRVCPALPETPGWSADRFYVPDDVIRRSVPNISGIMEYMMDIFAQRPQGGWTPNHPQVRQLQAAYGLLAADDINWHRLTVCPGVQYSPVGSHAVWESSFQNQENLCLPPRIANPAPVVNSWPHFLRLDFAGQDFHWFGKVLNLMTSYCRFWNHSSVLSLCTTSDRAAGLIKLYHEPTTTCYTHPTFVAAAPPAVTRAYYAMRISSHVITIGGSHVVPDLPAFHEQSALCTQFNCTPIGLNSKQQRSGPFWEVAPDVRKIRQLEIIDAVTAAINSSDFYSDFMIKDQKPL